MKWGVWGEGSPHGESVWGVRVGGGKTHRYTPRHTREHTDKQTGVPRRADRCNEPDTGGSTMAGQLVRRTGRRWLGRMYKEVSRRTRG